MMVHLRFSVIYISQEFNLKLWLHDYLIRIKQVFYSFHSISSISTNLHAYDLESTTLRKLL